MNKEIHKIAIIRLSALGDIVNSAIVLQFIHAKYPHIKIDWIVEEVFAPLLQNHPLIHKVHTVNIKKIKKEKSFSLLKKTVQKLLSLDNYDLIIDMQGLIKSAVVTRLLGSQTHGFDKNSIREPLASFFYKSTASIPYGSNVVKRNTFLISDALNFEINEEMIQDKQVIFPVEKLDFFPTEGKKIAIVIGASWESKIYPKESIVTFCNALKKPVSIIWGSEHEKNNAEYICNASPYASLAPQLTLPELVTFISKLDLLIGNDTGPTHIAWAQNTPSITLFGPTTTRMICQTPHNIGLESPSTVDILKIDKNDFSIKEIPYQLLLEKTKELLDGL